jgi:SET domain-containing protein
MTKVLIKESAIHGCGVFAAQSIQPGTIVRWSGSCCGVNHSCSPNLDTDWRAKRGIASGEELTISYPRPVVPCNCGYCRW